MAEIAEVYPSKLICGILYHTSVDLEAVYSELTRVWGQIDFESQDSEFSRGSNYYEHEMGYPLYRRFIAFENQVRPDALAEHKLLTQSIEKKWAEDSPLKRPLNLDPGHVTRGRLLLATTKDYAHRVYLHSGIYAEVTLMFKKNRIEKLPWTYPDIADGRWDEFFLKVKDSYHKDLLPLVDSSSI